MESDTLTQRMPYALFSCLMQVRDAHSEGKLELPLAAESLRKLGMPKWHVFPTKRSLEDLRWFHDGYPTPIFEHIVRAYQSDPLEYQSALQKFLQEKDPYAMLFTHITDAQVDLANASATRIEKFFTDYEPQGQAKDMAYLFLALAREANMIPDVKKVSHLSNGKFASKSGRAIVGSKNVGVSEEGKSMNDLPQVSVTGRTAMHQDAKTSRIERHRKYVLELLESLPTPQWEEEDRKWWVDALRTNVDLLIKPFVRKDEDMDT